VHASVCRGKAARGKAARGEAALRAKARGLPRVTRRSRVMSRQSPARGEAVYILVYIYILLFVIFLQKFKEPEAKVKWQLIIVEHEFHTGSVRARRLSESGVGNMAIPKVFVALGLSWIR